MKFILNGDFSAKNIGTTVVPRDLDPLTIEILDLYSIFGISTDQKLIAIDNFILSLKSIGILSTSFASSRVKNMMLPMLALNKSDAIINIITGQSAFLSDTYINYTLGSGITPNTSDLNSVVKLITNMTGKEFSICAFNTTDEIYSGSSKHVFGNLSISGNYLIGKRISGAGTLPQAYFNKTAVPGDADYNTTPSLLAGSWSELKTNFLQTGGISFVSDSKNASDILSNINFGTYSAQYTPTTANWGFIIVCDYISQSEMNLLNTSINALFNELKSL